MTPELDAVLSSLTDIQREATSCGDGAALVLAGPGSGKTRVLTARIARLLDESRNRNFRILALTFTTKAAAEMRERVEQLVPGMTERVFIGTFHAFCTQPAGRGEPVSTDDVRWLHTIDELKSRLVVPEKAASRFKDSRTGQAVCERLRDL
jgi:DNA helicase II / ATP-dependent DNA helicase PcrA